MNNFALGASCDGAMVGVGALYIFGFLENGPSKFKIELTKLSFTSVAASV